jgi:hypothetical protein
MNFALGKIARYEILRTVLMNVRSYGIRCGTELVLVCRLYLYIL